MKDGIYRVTIKYLCSGFVLENYKVTRCAPILKKILKYWINIAKLVLYLFFLIQKWQIR